MIDEYIGAFVSVREQAENTLHDCGRKGLRGSAGKQDLRYLVQVRGRQARTAPFGKTIECNEQAAIGQQQRTDGLLPFAKQPIAFPDVVFLDAVDEFVETRVVA